MPAVTAEMIKRVLLCLEYGTVTERTISQAIGAPAGPVLKKLLGTPFISGNKKGQYGLLAKGLRYIKGNDRLRREMEAEWGLPDGSG